jgi:hypothetical protein
MDAFIDFIYRNGIYLVVFLAAVKAIIIFIYRGLDIAYLFENFLVVYSSPGIEPNLKRKKFRTIHNILTVVFYFALILWVAITGVVKYAQ